MVANFFFFVRGHISLTQQKVPACVIRCVVANNARSHSCGCGQGANGKDVETCEEPYFFAAPNGSSGLAMTSMSMSHNSWLQQLCQPTSMRNSPTLLETPASPWQPGGQTARLRYDWPSSNRYCWPDTSAAGVGGAILPDLSLFVAVKIPLAGSLGDRLSPTHPSLTRRPLSLKPALTSGSTGAGGLGPATAYWFVSSALRRSRNNGDLNVRQWSHFELKWVIKTYCQGRKKDELFYGRVRCEARNIGLYFRQRQQIYFSDSKIP